ncbi:protein diaphanous homolog 1 isoform 2-T9 [Leptosomus discolor]
MEMKKTKRNFEEKLLDACGGKEMLDMEEQQMTAEKQELASRVCHPSEEVERLKEELEDTEREMASRSSLPAALLPGTTGHMQPLPGTVSGDVLPAPLLSGCSDWHPTGSVRNGYSPSCPWLWIWGSLCTSTASVGIVSEEVSQPALQLRRPHWTKEYSWTKGGSPSTNVGAGKSWFRNAC